MGVAAVRAWSWEARSVAMAVRGVHCWIACGGSRPGKGSGGAPRRGRRAEHAAAGDTDRSAVTVFVIAMENQDATDLRQRRPTRRTSTACSIPRTRTRRRSPTSCPTLPSEPHYVWMEAGTNAFADQTFTTDNDPSATNSTASTRAPRRRRSTAAGGLVDVVPGGHHAATDVSDRRRPASTGRSTIRSCSSATSSAIRRRSDNARLRAHHHESTPASRRISPTATSPATDFITPNLCHDMHGATGCSAARTAGRGRRRLARRRSCPR